MFTEHQFASQQIFYKLTECTNHEWDLENRRRNLSYKMTPVFLYLFVLYIRWMPIIGYQEKQRDKKKEQTNAIRMCSSCVWVRSLAINCLHQIKIRVYKIPKTLYQLIFWEDSNCMCFLLYTVEMDILWIVLTCYKRIKEKHRNIEFFPVDQ